MFFLELDFRILHNSLHHRLLLEQLCEMTAVNYFS